MKLYGMVDSGNCYKPRLLLAKLEQPFEHVEVSSHTGATRSAEYMAKNPNGMVPLVELEDGRLLAESNAILLYFAEGTPLLPTDRYARGLAYQWLFFEQYSHEPYIAVRKALLTVPGRAKDATPERLALTLERGNKALGVMEKHLSGSDFFVGNTMSVADIALYAYTHEAGKGGFDLSAYPAVSDWLARVAAEPGHVPIEWLP
ncbi:glutathione S-transferase family protein [Mesorhizobium sp. KR2-14]|uniref:glutathione S-transferase family protein n=1 Tax=Mesorhizobium sp. KR2-14 TaxID=3156610 RepID=UPI0032B46EB0